MEVGRGVTGPKLESVNGYCLCHASRSSEMRLRPRSRPRIGCTPPCSYTTLYATLTPQLTHCHTLLPHTAIYTQIDDGDVMMRLDATHEHWGWKDSR